MTSSMAYKDLTLNNWLLKKLYSKLSNGSSVFVKQLHLRALFAAGVVVSNPRPFHQKHQLYNGEIYNTACNNWFDAM